MKTETNIETRTISSIVYSKYLDTLERTSFEKIVDMTARISIGIVISVGLVKASVIRDALVANDWALVKTISGMSIGWHSKFLLGYARDIWNDIRTERTISREQREDVASVKFDGVDVEKIADFIMETKSWKRTEVEKLGLGRSSIDKIGTGLEKVGAFTRGLANARVLSE